MRILETGHYYAAKGPTRWAQVGWEVMLRMRIAGDKSMLFIDDMHGWEDVSPAESKLPTVRFNPCSDHVVLESEMVTPAWEVLETLSQLSKRKRARKRNGIWYCSGFPLCDEESKPNCLLLDAGLTLVKRQMGFKEGINILPYFYEEQQSRLLRLVAKALPDFHLRVVLYNLNGETWDVTA